MLALPHSSLSCSPHEGGLQTLFHECDEEHGLHQSFVKPFTCTYVSVVVGLLLIYAHVFCSILKQGEPLQTVQCLDNGICIDMKGRYVFLLYVYFDNQIVLLF